MKKMLILSALLLSSSAFAASPSFDSVGVTYWNAKDSPAEAVQVHGSKTFGDSYFVAGSVTEFSHTSVGAYDLQLGLVHSLTPQVDLFGSVDATHYSSLISHTYYGASVGAKYAPLSQLELGYKLKYTDFHDENVVSNLVSADVRLGHGWVLGVGYEFGQDDADAYNATVRYEF